MPGTNIRVVTGAGVEDEHDDLALRAATMYYLQDLTMSVIAKHLGLSSSTVSRLIKHAKAKGLVEIRVATILGHPGLARKIKDKYDVTSQVVVGPAASAHEVVEQLARAAGRQYATWQVPDMVLALSAGPIALAIAGTMTFPGRGMTVAAFTGADSQGFGVRTLEIARGKIGGVPRHLPVPLRVAPEIAPALRDTPEVRQTLDVAARAHMALFELFDDQIAGQAPDPSGIISLTRAELLGIQWRVGMMPPDGDLDLLHWALGEGLMTHLLVGESTARALLELR